MARGTLIKRQTKTKGVVWDIKFRTGDGTQVKRAIGPSKQEAQRALNEELAAVQRGERRSTSSETFKQAAERWLERKRPRIESSTYRDYEIHLRRLADPELRKPEAPSDHPGKGRELPRRAGRRRRAQPQDDQRQPDPAPPDPGAGVRDGVLGSNPAKNDDRDHPLELPYERPTMRSLNREEALRLPGRLRRLVPAVGRGAARRRSPDRRGNRAGVARRRLGRQRAGGLPLGEGQRRRHAEGDRSRTVLLAPYLLDVLREHRNGQASGEPPRSSSSAAPKV